MKIQMKKQCGFTLIELLITLGIMAIFSLLCYQGLSGLLRARDAATLRTDQLLSLQSTMEQMRIDLQYATEPAKLARNGNEQHSLSIKRRNASDHKSHLVSWIINANTGTLSRLDAEGFGGAPLELLTEIKDWQWQVWTEVGVNPVSGQQVGQTTAAGWQAVSLTDSAQAAGIKVPLALAAKFSWRGQIYERFFLVNQ